MASNKIYTFETAKPLRFKNPYDSSFHFDGELIEAIYEIDKDNYLNITNNTPSPPILQNNSQNTFIFVDFSIITAQIPDFKESSIKVIVRTKLTKVVLSESRFKVSNA